VDGKSQLIAGKSIAFNIVFQNRSSAPVDDVHNFEGITIANMTELDAEKAA
jgi:hypothetical protein